jgi:hypothetical protein
MTNFAMCDELLDDFVHPGDTVGEVGLDTKLRQHHYMRMRSPVRQDDVVLAPHSFVQPPLRTFILGCEFEFDLRVTLRETIVVFFLPSPDEDLHDSNFE